MHPKKWRQPSKPLTIISVPYDSSNKVQSNRQLSRVENVQLCESYFFFRQCRYYFSRNTITRCTIVLFVRAPDIFAHAQAQKHAKCGSNYHTRWHLNTEKFKKLTSVPFLIVARTPKNDRLCSITTCKWWIDVLLINDAVTKTKYLKIEFWIPYPLVPDWFLQPKSFLD